ncbi:hypothetical protein NP493_1103g00049 [Ridgeia piscesae]|uniref:Uncharacterized protein n=1 Tax=Ridgeia piscesae TaxID=27915 RepID=A0AAD9KHY5_RIDPI|nr:hypothetical protein NP493_1103g00049 [Ridgeia piscesae]
MRRTNPKASSIGCVVLSHARSVSTAVCSSTRTLRMRQRCLGALSVTATRTLWTWSAMPLLTSQWLERRFMTSSSLRGMVSSVWILTAHQRRLVKVTRLTYQKRLVKVTRLTYQRRLVKVTRLTYQRRLVKVTRLTYQRRLVKVTSLT